MESHLIILSSGVIRSDLYFKKISFSVEGKSIEKLEDEKGCKWVLPMSKQEIIENEAKLVAVGVKKRLKRHVKKM